ncbi:hypothetical protein [Ostreiculturibacter nitratireducens]|uniref:hypothetical protein n=1 Tax=Ostreiculturibacter nitratireducens TaxID=3075226 RepID=UPI0031B6033A
MPAPTDDQLKDLWRHGVPLSKAWETYAHPDLKERWDAIPKLSGLEVLASIINDTAEAGKPLHESLQGAADQANAMLAVKAEMQAAVLGYVRDGHLFGFGYEPPRKLASVPVAIPKAIFSGKCDWDSNALNLGGMQFISVRLTTRRYRNEILGRAHVVASKDAPAKGRPGVGKQIEAVCRALIAEGLVDPTHSAKSHFPAIRERLDRHVAELPIAPGAISDETIRVHFSPIFNALKDTKKQ